MMSNSTRSPMFGGGLDENFVDHIADNYAKENPFIIKEYKEGFPIIMG